MGRTFVASRWTHAPRSKGAVSATSGAGTVRQVAQRQSASARSIARAVSVRLGRAGGSAGTLASRGAREGLFLHLTGEADASEVNLERFTLDRDAPELVRGAALKDELALHGRTR